MFMATKTITIMEDAYNLLLNRKNKNESFSEVIRRMTGEKKDIMRLAGAWKHLSDKDVENRKKLINKIRKDSTKQLFRRIEEMRKQ